MVEEQKQEPTKEQPGNNADAGNQSPTITLIDRADSIVKRMEETEKRLDEKTKHFEELLARNLISGRADAGQPKKTREEELKEAIEAEAKRSAIMYG